MVVDLTCVITFWLLSVGADRLPRRRLGRLLPDCAVRRRARPHHQEAAGDRRRTAAADDLVAVGRGWNADQRGEAGAEGAEAGEADQAADLGDREVGRAEQVLGAFDPATGEVGARRLAEGAAEGAREVEARV